MSFQISFVQGGEANSKDCLLSAFNSHAANSGAELHSGCWHYLGDEFPMRVDFMYAIGYYLFYRCCLKYR